MLPRIPGSAVSPTGGIGSGAVIRNASGETTRLYFTTSDSSPRYSTSAHPAVTPAPSSSSNGTTRRTTTSGSRGGGGWRAWWNNNSTNSHRSHRSRDASLPDDFVEETSNNDDAQQRPPLSSYGTVQADTVIAAAVQEDDVEEAEHDDDDEQEEEDTIALLTRRLRCLFGLVTLPIVPLGTLSSLTLLWMLYAAFVLDGGFFDGDHHQSCAQPLHLYAGLSLFFLVYAPYHSRIRTFVLLYIFRDYTTSSNRSTTTGSRTPRPASVRRYDQIFHTIALFYVYGGITLVSTCRDDVSHLVDHATTTITTISSNTMEQGDSAGGQRLLSFLNDGSHDSSGHSYNNDKHYTHNNNNNNDYDNMDDSNDDYSYMNACQATCPHLYPALRIYVATLEIFTFSLILPLLFLPCLYLYFIRRTMADAEALSVLQERLRDEEALLRNGGVTADEIMSHLEEVQLYLVKNNDNGNSSTSSTSASKIMVVSKEQASPRKDMESRESDKHDNNLQMQEQPGARQYVECRSKECCICMENFTLHHGYNTSPCSDDDDNDNLTQNSTNDDDDHGDDSHENNPPDIETGYSSFESMSSSSSSLASSTNAETTQLIQHEQQEQESPSGRTTSLRNRTSTTRCSNSRNTDSSNSRHAVVRSIKCGHLFHKRCIASWVSGRWEFSSDNGREESSSRRARRTTCPLCRQDLRPDR